MMKRWTLGIATMALALGSVAWAQEEPQGPPPPPFPGGGPGGPGGPGFGGPRGRMGMPRGPIRLSLVPAPALSALLGLSEYQEAKIAEIQRGLRQGMRPPQPPQPGEFPQPPSQEEIEQRQAAEKRASAAIEGVLSGDQKRRVPTALKALQALRDAGAPPHVAAELGLTDEQVGQLAALAPKNEAPQPGRRGQRGPMGPDRELRQRVLAILTAEQREMLPEGPMHGGPGFGGPGGGRRGGGRPPFPGGGPGGPDIL